MKRKGGESDGDRHPNKRVRTGTTDDDNTTREPPPPILLPNSHSTATALHNDAMDVDEPADTYNLRSKPCQHIVEDVVFYEY
jgi:hypothetical protein